MSRELKDQRATLISQARAMLDVAEGENRDLNAEEQTQYDGLLAQIDTLKARIDRFDRVAAFETETEQMEPRRTSALPALPNSVQEQRGRDEVHAMALYIKRGDASGLMDLRAASNATDMNIGTPADGGYAVPTGHYQGIIAKRDSQMLANVLGVMRVPGVGTTVNVPIDDGTANNFVSTAETVAFDQDAPVLNQVAMTLVKYTKQITLSYELLEDEDSNLMIFLNDYVGRAAALTHNSLLMTEVLANGTSVALATAASVTAGDAQTLVYSIKPEYTDNVCWVMRPATEGALRKLTTVDWAYAPMMTDNPTQTAGTRLWGYPIYHSSSAAAIGAGNKSIAFGNFGFVGMREGAGMQFLRDPYSKAGNGQVNLWYYMRIVYKVLIAEAVLYGKHPTA